MASDPYRYGIYNYALSTCSSTITGGEKKMSLVQKVKDLTAPKDVKLLKKYGAIDECGEPTDGGIELMDSILFNEYKSKLVEKLEALEAAEKKEKTKK